MLLHPALATISLVSVSLLVVPVFADNDIQEIYALEGKTETLQCPCTTSSVVWYWYKGTKLIASTWSPPNGRYDVSGDGRNLTITDFTKSDQGTYECRMILQLSDLPECIMKLNMTILAVHMEPCNDPAGLGSCDCFFNATEMIEITCTASGFPSRPTIQFTSSDEAIASIPSTNGDLWSSTATIETSSSSENRVVTCSASSGQHSVTTSACLVPPPPAVRMEPCRHAVGRSDCDCVVDVTEEVEITCTASWFQKRPTLLFIRGEGHPIHSISSTDSKDWSATATIEPLTTENQVLTCSASTEQQSARINACLVSTPQEKDQRVMIGVVVGAILLVAIIVVVVVVVVVRKRKRICSKFSSKEGSREAQGQDESDAMMPMTTMTDGPGDRKDQKVYEPQSSIGDNPAEVATGAGANHSFQKPILKEDKDCDDNEADNEIRPDSGDPLIIQILRDDLESLSADTEGQNVLIDDVRGILREYETGRSSTKGSSGNNMMHSSRSKLTDSQMQKQRIQRFLTSTKCRLSRLSERDERHLRDKCELHLSIAHINPPNSAPPELNITEADPHNRSHSQLTHEECENLHQNLEHILTRNELMHNDERFFITRFILDAYEEDQTSKPTGSHGSGLSTRYPTTQQNTPNARIARFWVEKIMSLCDVDSQYRVYTCLCDYV